jgi:hypothetical protein
VPSKKSGGAAVAIASVNTIFVYQCAKVALVGVHLFASTKNRKVGATIAVAVLDVRTGNKRAGALIVVVLVFVSIKS